MFISLEGIEGTGKTTQIRLVADRLRREGYKVVTTVEPGGTRIGERVRDILLDIRHKNMVPVAELLLYNAARAQHLVEVILPSLKEGKIVLTDRFSDSTIAYQGYGRGIDLKILYETDGVATMGIKPDLTLLFDLDVEEGLKRNMGINKVDRLELEDVTFHEKVRAGFIELSRKEPERFEIIDASMPVTIITEIVLEAVKKRVRLPSLKG